MFLISLGSTFAYGETILLSAVQNWIWLHRTPLFTNWNLACHRVSLNRSERGIPSNMMTLSCQSRHGFEMNIKFSKEVETLSLLSKYWIFENRQAFLLFGKDFPPGNLCRKRRFSEATNPKGLPLSLHWDCCLELISRGLCSQCVQTSFGSLRSYILSLSIH